MSEIFDGLKKYYDETPVEVLAHKAKELDYLNEIGPDALEYIRSVRSYQPHAISCPKFNIPESSENTVITPNQRFYLAA